MVYYCFNKRERPLDPVDLKGKLRKIRGDIIFSFGIVFFQFFLIFYTQYQLFHRNIDNATCYFTTLALFLVSGAITMSFNWRKFVRNKEEFTPVMGMATGSLVIMNFAFTHFAPAGAFGEVLTHIASTSFLCIQIPSFLRNLAVLENGVKCYRTLDGDETGQEYYYRMIDAKADAGFCGLLDCFLRGTPQQILQIALIMNGNIQISQISVLDQIPIWIPLVMLPWAATAYQESLRKQQNESFPFCLYLTWNILLLTARNVSIGAIMSLYSVPVSCVILVHCLFATIWLCYILQPLEFYNCNKFLHIIFCSIFGFVYIWEPVNLKKKATNFKFKIWFYVIIFMENSLALFFWVLNAQFKTMIFRVSFAIFFKIVFITGIVLKSWYYKKLHSSRLNNVCFPKDIPVEL